MPISPSALLYTTIAVIMAVTTAFGYAKFGPDLGSLTGTAATITCTILAARYIRRDHHRYTGHTD